MIATTMSSSIRVKPSFFCILFTFNLLRAARWVEALAAAVTGAQCGVRSRRCQGKRNARLQDRDIVANFHCYEHLRRVLETARPKSVKESLPKIFRMTKKRGARGEHLLTQPR
jgi:hypothetical protein